MKKIKIENQEENEKKREEKKNRKIKVRVSKRARNERKSVVNSLKSTGFYSERKKKDCWV